MILHGYFRSSCTYRINIALRFKGIHFEYRPVNLLKNEHKSENYLKLNPQGLVPVLEHNGHFLTQSLTILEYLEDQFPTPALLPNESYAKARVRALSQIIACDIQPVQNLRVLKYVSAELKGTTEDRQKWGRHFISMGFEALESGIKESAGTFCLGENFSMVDVCLVPQVYNAMRFGVEIERFPLISKIYFNCLQMAAVHASQPELQSDCPPDLRESGR